MNKKLLLFLVTLITAMSFSFAAPAKAVPAIEGEEIAEEERAYLVFKKTVSITRIDEYYNQYKAKDKKIKTIYNKKLNDYNKERTAFIQAGEHELEISYQSKTGYANGTTLKATFEAGKTYDVVTIVEEGIFGKTIKYDIQDSETHESIYAKALKLGLAIQYVNKILQPVSEGKEMTLSAMDFKRTGENNKSEYIIEYGPDLTVTYTEKETTYKGYIGFEATKAIIYIQFDEDGSLTKDAFLSMSPEDCDRVFELKEVTSIGPVITVKISSIKPENDAIISLGYLPYQNQ